MALNRSVSENSSTDSSSNSLTESICSNSLSRNSSTDSLSRNSSTDSLSRNSSTESLSSNSSTESLSRNSLTNSLTNSSTDSSTDSLFSNTSTEVLSNSSLSNSLSRNSSTDSLFSNSLIEPLSSNSSINLFDNKNKFRENDIIQQISATDNRVVYYHIECITSCICSKYNFEENDCYIVNILIDLNKLKENNRKIDLRKISAEFNYAVCKTYIKVDDQNKYKFINNINLCELKYITKKEFNKYYPGFIDSIDNEINIKFKKNDIIKEIKDTDDIFYYHIEYVTNKKYNREDIDGYNVYIVNILIDLNKLKKNYRKIDLKKISAEISLGCKEHIKLEDQNNYKVIKNINLCKLKYITRKEFNEYCPNFIDSLNNKIKFRKNDIIKDIRDTNNIFYYYIQDVTSIYLFEDDDERTNIYEVNTLIDLNKLKNNNREIDLRRICSSISYIGHTGNISVCDKNNYKFINNINLCELKYITRKECEKYCPEYIDYKLYY